MDPVSGRTPAGATSRDPPENCGAAPIAREADRGREDDAGTAAAAVGGYMGSDPVAGAWPGAAGATRALAWAPPQVVGGIATGGAIGAAGTIGPEAGTPGAPGDGMKAADAGYPGGASAPPAFVAGYAMPWQRWSRATLWALRGSDKPL
mmetsp:Transcript_20376/g.51684  ORF Transcript_20376/g.51684 Transcript_20376/m.51684 type:complete len:149 (-) Transcript_20376:39-485(-)